MCVCVCVFSIKRKTKETSECKKMSARKAKMRKSTKPVRLSHSKTCSWFLLLLIKLQFLIFFHDEMHYEHAKQYFYH